MCRIHLLRIPPALSVFGGRFHVSTIDVNSNGLVHIQVCFRHHFLRHHPFKQRSHHRWHRFGRYFCVPRHVGQRQQNSGFEESTSITADIYFLEIGQGHAGDFTDVYGCFSRVFYLSDQAAASIWYIFGLDRHFRLLTDYFHAANHLLLVRDIHTRLLELHSRQRELKGR